MANKQILSIVAASILAASFTLTGCGSSSSDSSTSSIAPVSSESMVSSDASTSSEAAAEPISVTAFRLLEANATKGGTEASIIDDTTYEFPEGTTGVLATTGGAYDTNGDNNATSEDANAPALAAPATFSNINALSTLQAQGVSIEDINTFYNLELETTDIAIDSADLPVYAANAKAALRLSGYLGDDVSTSSDSDTTSSASTSSASTSSIDASNPYPSAALRSPYPEDPSSSAEESSEAASSSSESTDSNTAYADIDACSDAECIDAVLGAELIDLNDSYGSENTSSDGSTSSEQEASSSDEASSSSIDASNPYPAAAL
jgi:hypothetical protein